MHKLFDFIHKNKITPLNPLIADGYSTYALKNVIQHIDAYTRCGIPTLEGTGLEYVGIIMPTPEQSFAELVKKTSQRAPTFDVANSDLYMVKMHWRFHGTDIYHSLFLPYCRSGNLIMLRGSMFAIHPVLVDKSFSIGVNDLFFPFTRARINIYKTLHQRLQDSKDLVYSSLIYSPVYNRSKDSLRKQGTVLWRPVSALGHYLFCVKGVREAFKHYANVDIIIGDSSTINSETINLEELTYFESAGIVPSKFGNNRTYFKSDIRLAVRREELTPGVDGLINAFFYVIDFFPEKIKLEYIDTENEKIMWTQVMGDIIFPTGVNPGKLLEDMIPHFESLYDYVDVETRIKLESDNIYCKDFFELCYYIIDKFDFMVLDGIDKVSSMYDKKLEVLKYVAAPITSGIFLFIFNIKKGKGTLTPKTVSERLNKFVRTKEIMSINHKHGEVQPIMVSNDNKALRVTTALVAQTSSSGTNSKKKVALNDPTQHLDVSFAEIGQFAAITKSDPSGKGFINPTVQVDHKGYVLKDSKLDALREKTQNIIKR